MKSPLRRKLALSLLIFGAFSLSAALLYQESHPAKGFESSKKVIEVRDGGASVVYAHISQKTIGEFLEAEGIGLNDGDTVFPALETRLMSGDSVTITRSRSLSVSVDGGKRSIRTQAITVEQALGEAGISLDEDDIIEPGKDVLAADNLAVRVIRVQIAEEAIDKPVPYKTETHEDDGLSWRKAIVTQKGAPGTERFTYRVSSHDGKEVARRLLKREIIAEPVTQIVTQGTYVKVGKAHTGGASWYAYTGTMSAANPWLPLGSYVRVTNTSNNKSVIVRINDRGPFGAGRIIDLDKVAFEKLAPLGAGVINVKMEEITN